MEYIISNYRKFKLKIITTEYWFWVKIHPDLASLRAAAAEHDGWIGAPMPIRGAGDESGYYGRTLGVTHKFTRVTYTKHGEQVEYPNIGIIRLAQGHIPPGIIAHELMHAVAWTFKLKYGPNMGAAYKNGWREEKLARMYGETFREMNLILHKKGFWS